MPFEPVAGQNYRIIAKHSGKAIGVKNKLPHQGEIITQVKPEGGDATQEFELYRDGAYYNLVVRQNNKTQSVDVFGEKRDENAAVGQWHRSAGHWNQQF